MTAQPKRRPINATQAPSSNNEEALEQKKTIPSGVGSSIENTELKETNEPVSIAPELSAVSDNPEAKDENPVMLPESDEEWEKKIAEAKKNVEQKKEIPVLHEPSSALAPQKDLTPVTEPAVDLALIMAVISSYRNVPISGRTIIFGEVGLTGEVRAVSQASQRVSEAIKIGFEKIIMPKANLPIQDVDVSEINIIGVSNIREALQAVE